MKHFTSYQNLIQDYICFGNQGITNWKVSDERLKEYINLGD